LQVTLSTHWIAGTTIAIVFWVGGATLLVMARSAPEQKTEASM